ncbi:hypothetical protein NF27_FX00360 [Candidatus Jidaibacter acanthamoeba]|uniref:Uncharacterized protein n=1 Tax=Candidatus Jidaibacter acanthamoebae TaxID=86105 RepID=A0A0C1QXL4_9RICK|nr:hypothetical protein [Candidatus Jidaibacter acanthamoeba]KIE04775.1 hypothetical protein NF27_FX00360 [Candidatus Jidaibacter acanthamoeba]
MGSFFDIDKQHKADTPESYSIEKNMDLWNNRAGRIAAIGCKTKEEFAQKLAQDLKDGKLITNPETDKREFKRDDYSQIPTKEQNIDSDEANLEDNADGRLINQLNKLTSLLKLKEQFNKEQEALKKEFIEKLTADNELQESQLEGDFEAQRASLQASADAECNAKGEALKASTPCNKHNSDSSTTNCIPTGGYNSRSELCTTTYHCTIKVDCGDITAKYQQAYDAYVKQKQTNFLEGSKALLDEQGKLYKAKLSNLAKQYEDLSEAVTKSTGDFIQDHFGDTFQNANQAEQIFA